MNQFERWGLLLMNLGTPDSTEVSDVRRYLREFLSDPRVLDINPVLRSFLLNFVILPRRPADSAEAYEKVWTKDGSPLTIYTEQLRDGLAEQLPGVQIEYCMRYQNPPVEEALASFRAAGIDRIVLVPLFPQNSSAAWGSAVQEVYEAANELWNVPSIHVVPPFYAHPEYVASFATIARPILDDMKPDHILFSYHGLPERHCTKSDESRDSSHCLQSDGCCDRLVHANRNCYRAQCFESTRRIAAELELDESDYTVTFQSRLGNDPWIQPFTDQKVEELGRRGTQRLAVLSPAFVADCLETLEEIAIGLREDFKSYGGDDLQLIPSLNAHPRWVDGLATLLRTETPLGWQIAQDADASKVGE